MFGGPCTRFLRHRKSSFSDSPSTHNLLMRIFAARRHYHCLRPLSLARFYSATASAAMEKRDYGVGAPYCTR